MPFRKSEISPFVASLYYLLLEARKEKLPVIITSIIKAIENIDKELNEDFMPTILELDEVEERSRF